MRHEVDIKYPADRMAANRERWVAWKNYEYADRVRVQAGVETRYMLAARGVTWPDYMDNVEDHYFHQLLNQKWRIENVPDDFCTEPVILVLMADPRSPRAPLLPAPGDRRRIPPWKWHFIKNAAYSVSRTQ